VLIGYLRGGSEGALTAQRQALADAGCDQVAEDLTFGRRAEQLELRRVLDHLQEGDVIVVPELDCLGRSLPEVVQRLQRITAAGAGLRSLKERINTTTPEGRAAAGVIGGLAGLDRDDRGERIAAGLAAARAQGRKPGRRPKLGEQQRAAVVEAVLSGRSTAAKMTRRNKVSEATISRIMAAHRNTADARAEELAAAARGSHVARIAGALPLAALDGRLAIVGTSGSGKTYTAKGLVERLLDQGCKSAAGFDADQRGNTSPR